MSKKDIDPDSKAALLMEGTLVPDSPEEANAIFNQMVGQVGALNFFTQFSEVMMLKKLKDFKDRKMYKDVIVDGKSLTWAKACEQFGVSRRTIDEKLAIISDFAEDFLAVSANFIGRDFNKIKQLSAVESGGSANFTGELIEYKGKTLKIAESNQDELNGFLQEIIDDYNEAQKNSEDMERYSKGKEKVIKKLSKELSKHERDAKELGLNAEDQAFVEYMEQVKIGFDGWAANCTVAHMEIEAEDMTPAKRASLLSTLLYMRNHGKMLYDEAVDKYSEGLDESDEGWNQPSA